MVVEAHLGVHRMAGGDPLHGALHLAAVLRPASAGGRVVGAMHLGDVAGGVFDHPGADDVVGMLQAHLFARGQAKIFLGRMLFKIFPVDVKLPGERHHPSAGALVFRIVHCFQLFDFIFGIVLDHQLERVEHCHHPQGPLIEIFAHRIFQLGDVHRAVGFGQTDHLREVADRLRGVAPPAQAGEGGHARIVPAADVLVAHQLQQLALAHHRVVEAEAGEFDLLRGVDPQFFHKPVVERAVRLKLQGAEGVGDALDGIALPMGPVVHRVDAPLVAGAVMGGVEDAVHHRVAQVDVGRTHVDLGAQHSGAIGKFSVAHPPEQVEILLHRAVAVGTVFARAGESAAVFADLVGAKVVHISFAGLNQLHCVVVELAEIIRGEKQPVFPVEAQPLHISHDRFDILHLLFGRIGVVETQVAFAAVFLGQAEVQADRLGVADMQIAVRLRRKAGVHPALVLAAAQVFLDDGADKVGGRRGPVAAIITSIRGIFAIFLAVTHDS